MKAHLFCLLLITGCGQPATTEATDSTNAVEHLAESEVAAAEVDSLEPAQNLKVSLQEDQQLRFERLSDLSRVIVELQGKKTHDIIDWLGRLKSIGVEGTTNPPAFIHCHRDCAQETCSKICCVEVVGKVKHFCSSN